MIVNQTIYCQIKMSWFLLIFFKGEVELAGDVICMLDELCVSKEDGMHLVPELYLVKESDVSYFLYFT